MTDNLLNVSQTKQAHAFPKAYRFKYDKSPTQMVSGKSYDKLSDFDRVVIKSKNKKQSFDSTTVRFNYMASRNIIVSPATYQIKDGFGSTKRGSIGLGRDQSYKLFVDEIINNSRKHLSPPGPGKYQKPNPFSQTGLLFTIRPKLDKMGLRLGQFDKSFYEQQKKLPGPGSYELNKVISNLNMPLSTIKREPSSSFSKAQDRFEVPAIHKQLPDLGTYSPKTRLVKNQSPQYKVGRNTLSVLDQIYGVKYSNETPGAKYKRFSEFELQ